MNGVTKFHIIKHSNYLKGEFVEGIQSLLRYAESNPTDAQAMANLINVCIKLRPDQGVPKDHQEDSEDLSIEVLCYRRVIIKYHVKKYLYNASLVYCMLGLQFFCGIQN